MSERKTFSASGTRAAPGRAAPTIGAPPGGRSLESFSSRIPSSTSAESFRTIRPHTTLKLENKQSFSPNKLAPKPKTENSFKSFQKIEPSRLSEIPKTRSSFETIKPITKEIKAPEIKATTPKGSQRFAQLGNTREYKITRSIDPLDRQIPRVEITGMKKIVEAPKPPQRTEVPDAFKKAFAKSPEATLNPTKAKVPEAFYKAFETTEKPKFEPTKFEKPEARTKRTQLIEALKDQKIPLAEMARKTRRETISSLMKDQNISLGEALKKDIPPTRARTELIKGLIENKSVSLYDALKKEPVTEAKKTEPLNDKRKLVADLLKNNSASLVEVFEKAIPEKTAAELTPTSPNKSRREAIKNLLKDQKVSLADILKTKMKKELAEIKNKPEINTAIQQKIVQDIEKKPVRIQNITEKVAELKQELPNTEAKNLVSFKTIEQNLEVVKKVLSENKQNPEQKLDQTVLADLIKQPNIIDFQKAKELIEQKQEKRTEALKVETSAQAVRTLEEIKAINETQIEKPAIAPQIEATIQVLQQPEKVNIEPEKRAEALQLLQEVVNTKEYAVNPKLQEQIKAVVKKEQEKVIEEAEIVQAAQYLIEAGAEPEIVTERLQAVIEVKQLPVSPEQLQILIQKAETKLTEGPKLIAENGQIIEENKQSFFDAQNEDEYQQMMRKLQLLLIELDEKTLENRFKAIFDALEKTWIQAHEEGWEKVDGSQIVANLPNSEPIEQKSEIIRPFQQTDGSLVETTKDIANMGRYDDLDQARQVLTAILINHLPGKATNQPTTQVLSDQQVQEIFRGGNYSQRSFAYPSQMGNFNVNNMPLYNTTYAA